MINSEIRDGLTKGGWKETRVANEEMGHKDRSDLGSSRQRFTWHWVWLTFQQPKQVSGVSLKAHSREEMGGSAKSHWKRHEPWEGRGNEAINSAYRSNTTCLLMHPIEFSLAQLSPHKTSYTWIALLLPRYLSISPEDILCKKCSTSSLEDEYFHLTPLTAWR